MAFVRTYTEDIPNWPAEGHRCQIVAHYKDGSARAFQAEAVHYENNKAIYSEMFSSKTKAMKFIRSLWGEYNGARD